MKIYVIDSGTAVMLKNAGYTLGHFKDINGSSIWEFSYCGEDLDIKELLENGKIIIPDNSKTVYL